MSILRSALLRASRSAWLADQFRRRAFARRAVRRFMPGEHMSDALHAAGAFAELGTGTVLTSLGEQVTSHDEARAVRDHYAALIHAVSERRLPVQVSVKLSHLGLDVDPALCTESVRTLARAAEAAGSMLWIDMEESWYVDRTLAVYRAVRPDVRHLGICLQAYLHRTPADLDALLPLWPHVRLVKGAYREPPDVAHERKQDTDRAYVELAARVLERAGQGSRLVLGTHDDAIVREVRARAAGMRDAPGFEVHMLYGIRATMQQQLEAYGVPVRVLISYGEHWFPWYVRRIAERPANLWFVAKSMVAR